MILLFFTWLSEPSITHLSRGCKLNPLSMLQKACFMLAVSLDTLPSISSRRKFKSPTRTHQISQVWTRCPSEHHNVLVINIPNRSTALTCRRTEPFGSFLLYAIFAIFASFA